MTTTMDEKQMTEGQAGDVQPAEVATDAAPEAAAPLAEAAPAPAAEVEATEAAPAEEEAARPLRRVVDVSAPQEAAPAPAPAPAPTPAPEEPQEDFGALLDASETAQAATRVQAGDKVQGRIVHIGDDNLFVDLGAKMEGWISRGEFTDADGNLTVAAGDTIEAYVVEDSAAGVHLSKALGQASEAYEALRTAWESGVPVEGAVTGVNKGGYDVQVLGQRAFCPMSQIDLHFTDKPETHVGQTYTFKVIGLDQKGKRINIKLSRQELLKAERADKQRATLATLEEGQVREGTVRSVQPFGVFVDLGGVDGLIHVSELSWNRVGDPNELVQVGQSVTVKVLRIEDAGRGPDKMRISLSMKAAQESPWDAVGDRFVEGQEYTGTVVRLESFGAFIQLDQGLDGLVHVSELSHRRIAHPREVVRVGDQVQVKILSIDFERERISLSLKELQADPWAEATQRYPEGAEVEGTVEKVERFGVFVRLEAGLTALLPQSELNTEPGRDPGLDFKAGDQVTARILAVDPERRRLTLTRKPAGASSAEAPAGDARPSRPRPPRRDNKERSGGGGGTPKAYYEDTGRGNGLGTLGDLLGNRLKGRK
jgi:small subunit ribosomal protein S1